MPRHRTSGEKNDLAGVALRHSRICVDRTKSLKTRLRARNRFARIAQARRKPLGPYLSITRNCLARNRVLVLAGVVAIARELVDRIAQVAHVDRLRSIERAGKKSASKQKNETGRGAAFTLAAATAKRVKGKSLPLRQHRVGATCYVDHLNAPRLYRSGKVARIWVAVWVGGRAEKRK